MTQLTNNPTPESEDTYEEDYRMTRAEYNDRKASLEEAIKGSEAAVRLFNNPDFKLLIVEGYFLQEPARLVGMLASDKMADDTNQKIIKDELMAIGKLKNRMSVITRSGYAAKEELEALNEYVGKHGIREA